MRISKDYGIWRNGRVLGESVSRCLLCASIKVHKVSEEEVGAEAEARYSTHMWLIQALVQRWEFLTSAPERNEVDVTIRDTSIDILCAANISSHWNKRFI